MLESNAVRNGVPSVIPEGSPGIFFTVSPKRPTPRLYMFCDNEGEAVAAAQTIWLREQDIQLYRDNGEKKRPKRIRVM